MSKITPEQVEKDHADLTHKTYKLEKLESLRLALNDPSEPSILSALGSLRQLNPCRVPGLRCYATAVYNQLKEEWVPDVDLPKLHSEGVIYTGRAGGKDVFANLDGGAALVLKDAIAGLGEHGNWELRSDGSIMLSCKPSGAGLQVRESEGDQVLECRDASGTLRVRMNLGPAECDLGASEVVMSMGESVTTPIIPISKKQRLINAETRISTLEGQATELREKVTALSAKLDEVSSVVQGMLYHREKQGTEKHWNIAEQLPPVGCDLMIKVPAGSYPHAEGKKGFILKIMDLDEDFELRVVRACHVQQRGNALTYMLKGENFDGFMIKGQFPWTYP